MSRRSKFEGVAKVGGYTVIGVGVGSIAGLFGSFGVGLSAGSGAYNSETPKEVRKDIAESIVDLKMAQAHQVRVKKQLGEKCVTTLITYTDGRKLAKTPETDAVNDVMADPVQPCGNSRTDVRTKLVDLRNAVDDVASDQDSLVDSRRYLASAIEIEQQTQNNTDITNSIMAFSLGIGALGGCLVGLKELHDEKGSVDGFEVVLAPRDVN